MATQTRAVQMPPSPPAPPPSGPGRAGHRARRVGIAVVAVVVMVILVAVAVLALFPVAHAFSGTVATAYCSGCSSGSSHYVGYQSEVWPQGSQVTFSWQSTSTNVVELSVFQAGGPAGFSCDNTGTSGSCDFQSTGGTYTLFLEDIADSENIQSVTFSGSYSAPTI
jgi:hypothetical protein